MASWPGRNELELQLARKLGRLSKEQMSHLMETLGDPPDLNKLPPEFWNDASEELRGIARPMLEAVFIARVTQAADALNIGLDMAVINGRAAEWAERYSFELVKGITDRTRANLQANVGSFFRDQRTIGDLTESIARDFSPVRAARIASTEVTRAATEGEHAFQEELRALGLKPEGFWETGDNACEAICQPNQGKPVSEVGSPPGHVGCDCWENTRIVAA